MQLTLTINTRSLTTTICLQKRSLDGVSLGWPLIRLEDDVPAGSVHVKVALVSALKSVLHYNFFLNLGIKGITWSRLTPHMEQETNKLQPTQVLQKPITRALSGPEYQPCSHTLYLVRSRSHLPHHPCVCESVEHCYHWQPAS